MYIKRGFLVLGIILLLSVSAFALPEYDATQPRDAIEAEVYAVGNLNICVDFMYYGSSNLQVSGSDVGIVDIQLMTSGPLRGAEAPGFSSTLDLNEWFGTKVMQPGVTYTMCTPILGQPLRDNEFNQVQYSGTLRAGYLTGGSFAAGAVSQISPIEVGSKDRRRCTIEDMTRLKNAAQRLSAAYATSTKKTEIETVVNSMLEAIKACNCLVEHNACTNPSVASLKLGTSGLPVSMDALSDSISSTTINANKAATPPREPDTKEEAMTALSTTLSRINMSGLTKECNCRSPGILALADPVPRTGFALPGQGYALGTLSTDALKRAQDGLITGDQLIDETVTTATRTFATPEVTPVAVDVFADIDQDGMPDTIDAYTNTPFGEQIYTNGIGVEQLKGLYHLNNERLDFGDSESYAFGLDADQRLEVSVDQQVDGEFISAFIGFRYNDQEYVSTHGPFLAAEVEDTDLEHEEEFLLAGLTLEFDLELNFADGIKYDLRSEEPELEALPRFDLSSLSYYNPVERRLFSGLRYQYSNTNNEFTSNVYASLFQSGTMIDGRFVSQIPEGESCEIGGTPCVSGTECKGGTCRTVAQIGERIEAGDWARAGLFRNGRGTAISEEQAVSVFSNAFGATIGSPNIKSVGERTTSVSEQAVLLFNRQPFWLQTILRLTPLNPCYAAWVQEFDDFSVSLLRPLTGGSTEASLIEEGSEEIRTDDGNININIDNSILNQPRTIADDVRSSMSPEDYAALQQQVMILNQELANQLLSETKQEKVDHNPDDDELYNIGLSGVGVSGFGIPLSIGYVEFKGDNTDVRYPFEADERGYFETGLLGISSYGRYNWRLADVSIEPYLDSDLSIEYRNAFENLDFMKGYRLNEFGDLRFNTEFQTIDVTAEELEFSSENKNQNFDDFSTDFLIGYRFG